MAKFQDSLTEARKLFIRLYHASKLDLKGGYMPREEKHVTSAKRLINLSKRQTIDAKRESLSETGVNSWYDYYAGYTVRFAKSILEEVRLPLNSVVLDPWNGCGTTTYVADQLGLTAIGVDLNPVAVLVANAKLARPKDTEYILGLANRIIKAESEDNLTESDSDPLISWLPREVVKKYRGIERLILSDLATGKDKNTLNPLKQEIPPLASFLLLALMRTGRSLASIKTASNPTWITPQDSLIAKSERNLVNGWLSFIETMSDELSFNERLHNSQSRSTLGDARALILPSESVNFVLTSPPYLTRIDYPTSTSFELASLKMSSKSDDFSDLRRATMGTPLVRKGNLVDPKKEWPADLQKLLKSIRFHPSKASQSYYYKTYWNYFDDCEKSLSELMRCLKPGAVAVLVIQGSYYKEIYVDLPSIYQKMAKKIGFKADLLSEIAVTHSLSQINTRASQYRSVNEDLCSESVILLEKR